MRIFNITNEEITSPDMKKGRLVRDKIFVKHHEAIESVPEEGHWETVKEYPNGGKDVDWIVDVAAVEAKEAWDEYEDILRYVEYTDEELAARNKPSMDERLSRIESHLQTILQLLTKTGGE